MSSATKNSARRNGKAWKKHPGVAPSAHTGRTQNGYLPATVRVREARRAVADPALRKENR